MYKHTYISLQFSDTDFSFGHVNLIVQYIVFVMDFLVQSHLNTFSKIQLHTEMQLLMKKKVTNYGLAALKGLVVMEVYLVKIAQV